MVSGLRAILATRVPSIAGALVALALSTLFAGSEPRLALVVTPGPDEKPATPPATDDQDTEIEYLAAVAADTIDAYRAFLKKYPGSPRAGQVRAVIAAKVEEDAWRRTVEAGTAGAYRQYLAAFPDGAHAGEAEIELAAIDSRPPKNADPPIEKVPPDTCGPEGPYRVVDVAANDILSIRASPDRTAPETGQIPPDGFGVSIGRCVTVPGYKAPWCEVRYQCQTGWSYARYLVDDSGRQPDGVAASIAPPVSRGTETYRVTGVEDWDFLNMRAGPGTNYAIVAPIPPNGSGIYIYSCRSIAGYRTKWCESEWQGHRGWASACCLVGERTGIRPD